MKYNDIFWKSDDEIVNKVVDKCCKHNRSEKIVKDVKLDREYGKQLGHMYRRGINDTGSWNKNAGRIYLGDEGLDKSWQKPFEKIQKCKKCNGICEPMFVHYEDQDDLKLICDFHEEKWLHDMSATCVYLCRECFEPFAVVNQG